VLEHKHIVQGWL